MAPTIRPFHFAARSFATALVPVCLIAVAAKAPAASNASQTFPVTSIDAPPAAALDFSVAPWTSVKPISDLENLTNRVPANFATSARIAIDGKALYVAIHCAQQGTPIVATQSANDVGFGIDDYAGIGIDTTGNGQAYYFETTPAGTKYEQATESQRYRPQWTALAHATGGDWDALLEIPFSVLRTSASKVQRWRFNIIRHIARLNENETLAFDEVMNDAGGNNFPVLGDSRFWPSLEGVRVVTAGNHPKPRLEVYALGSAGRDRTQYLQATSAFAPQGTRFAGLDANIPITGTTAFVGALAPDFSNVEIDQQTISPQEFRRNLTEYRPFFAQGASFFQNVGQVSVNEAPNVLLYTPGFGPFDRGAKIEGSQGFEQFGLLNVQGAGFNDSALALRHTLPDRTFLYSLIAVAAHHADGNATAFPFADNDTSYEANVAGRNLHTGFVYGLDYGAEHGSAPGTTPRLAYKSENFIDVHRSNYEWLVEYRDIGPRWNPIDGFTNVSDLRGLGSYLDLNGNPPPKSPIKRIELFTLADRLVDRSGAPRQVDVQANLDVIFRNQLHINGGPSVSSLRYYGNGSAFNGIDTGYTGGLNVPFNQHGFSLGYKDGTPTPIDASLFWGPFGTYNPDGSIRSTYLRQYAFSTSRPIGTHLSLGAQFDGTLESLPLSGRPTGSDGQILRAVQVADSLDANSNFSIALRSITGNGGFASPGVNLAASFHKKFSNDSELFINYGTPAAPATLQRFILKYLVRFGSGAGT